MLLVGMEGISGSRRWGNVWNVDWLRGGICWWVGSCIDDCIVARRHFLLLFHIVALLSVVRPLFRWSGWQGLEGGGFLLRLQLLSALR